MSVTKDQLLTRLEELDIAVSLFEHAPLFTVEDSQKLRGEIPGGHTKNLFLKDKKGALFLIVALEDAVIDLKRIHTTIDSARISFGKPELLMEVLGVPPGSVTPFSLINDTQLRVNIILDEPMMQHEQLNYHPLTNEATVTIARDGLIKFIRDCGHEPQIIQVSAPATGA